MHVASAHRSSKVENDFWVDARKIFSLRFFVDACPVPKLSTLLGDMHKARQRELGPQSRPFHLAGQTKGKIKLTKVDAGWSSPVARQAHNLKVTGSNPVPATNTFPPS
jgi:hypothetical protein